LQNFKGWEYGNNVQYAELLTKENWKEFLTYKSKGDTELREKFNAEKETWQKESNNEKYCLDSYDIEAIRKKADYVYVKNNIGESKGMDITDTRKGIKAKVFVPELAYIFFTRNKIQYTESKSKKLNLKGVDTQKEIKYFDGSKFMEYYTEAYRKGEEDFEKDFGVNKDTLYGANAKQYVSDIHYNYFHADIKSNDCTGWNHWRKTFPYIITKEVIAEYGYYSGFIGKVWSLATKHPKLFTDLDKCELREHAKKEQEQADTSETETQTENNVLVSTIEDWLFEFKEKMNEADYNILVSALQAYFENGTFPKIKKIKVGKVNKKLFGWALNQIYRAEKSDNLPKEYLLFAKENISLFTDVAFDEADILNSNLYKYFTTKTK
jgi:hypothetical protein